MRIKVKKNFLKQLALVPKDVRERIEFFVFETLPELDSLAQSGNIEKMHGYRSCFKVRFGDYRVGLIYENEVIVVKVVMHRREIYRFFP
ncbi:MAG: type II toxin-antitoxin system RelE family toxin [Pyrinomonadaceae bacterium]